MDLRLNTSERLNRMRLPWILCIKSLSMSLPDSSAVNCAAIRRVLAIILTSLMMASSAMSQQTSSNSLQTTAGITVSPTALLPGDPPLTYFVLPITPMLHHGGPLIHILLNNKIDAVFLLDTGASSCVIRRDVIDALGLKPQKIKKEDRKAGLGWEGEEKVTIDHIDIGPFIHSHGDFVVADAATRSLLDDKSVSGIFSADAFVSCSLLFDFEKQTVSIVPAGDLSSKQLAAIGMSNHLSIIPMTATNDATFPIFTIKARVTGGDNTFMDEDLVLDTGSDWTAFLGDPAHIHAQLLLKNRFRTLLGESDTTICLVSSLQVKGDDAEHGVSLNRFACNFRKEEPDFPTASNNLGMDFLSHFRVLIDYSARKLYLSPLGHGANLLYPTETTRVNGERQISDAIFKPSENGQWSVMSFAEQGGYFATKGLKIGDTVIAVQGIKADNLLADEFAAQIFDNIGFLKLTLLRNGLTIMITASQ